MICVFSYSAHGGTDEVNYTIVHSYFMQFAALYKLVDFFYCI